MNPEARRTCPLLGLFFGWSQESLRRRADRRSSATRGFAMRHLSSCNGPPETDCIQGAGSVVGQKGCCRAHSIGWGADLALSFHPAQIERRMSMMVSCASRKIGWAALPRSPSGRFRIICAKARGRLNSTWWNSAIDGRSHRPVSTDASNPKCLGAQIFTLCRYRPLQFLDGWRGLSSISAVGEVSWLGP